LLGLPGKHKSLKKVLKDKEKNIFDNLWKSIGINKVGLNAVLLKSQYSTILRLKI
jgi:hypothetical protein